MENLEVSYYPLGNRRNRQQKLEISIFVDAAKTTPDSSPRGRQFWYDNTQTMTMNQTVKTIKLRQFCPQKIKTWTKIYKEIIKLHQIHVHFYYLFVNFLIIFGQEIHGNFTKSDGVHINR